MFSIRRRTLALCLALLLLILSTGAAAQTVSLFVNVRPYFGGLTSFGVRIETPEWKGFSVSLEMEELSLLGKEAGPGDPFMVLPVNSIYTVSVSKRFGPLRVSYNHFSAHWHKLADYFFNDISDHGWYGDTYWSLDYTF